MSAEQSKVIWALDLDQTMLDTDMVFDEIAAICKAENITGGSALHVARKELEATGGSFDTFGYLSDAGASDEELDEVSRIVGDNADNKNYLYDDTLELLDTLDELEQPFMTVTWGSLRTQMPKLRATHLDERDYIVTEEKKKGNLIQTWKNAKEYSVVSDNGHKLEGQSVMLVDDKAKSFEGLPLYSAGYLVQRKPPKPSQRGEVPERIVKVKNLATITRILRDRVL